MLMHNTLTLKQFWEHASDKQHLLDLYNQDRYRCELGCKEDFTDALGRVYHYAMQKCRIDELEDYRYTTEGRAGPFDNDPSTRLMHYHKTDAPSAYNMNDAEFIDEACKLGFATCSSILSATTKRKIVTPPKYKPKFIQDKLLQQVDIESVTQDVLRYTFQTTLNPSYRWPLHSTAYLTPTRFLSKRKLKQIWSDISGVVQAALQPRYYNILNSGVRRNLDIKLILDWTDAAPL
ncbi:hypothetical protein KCU65_g4720, partial [Aureobasidium melanogenum]